MLRHLAVCAALASCGGGDGTTSGESDATSAVADAAPITCTHNGLALETEGAERDNELGVLFYTATSGAFPGLERLTFDFYFPFGAADGPQTVIFDGENLKDCHTCLVARRECDSASCASGKAFLVQEGTASITAMGDVGSPFQGTLSNAIFAEVTISAADLETTLVPGGETWCIDQLEFNTSIAAP